MDFVLIFGSDDVLHNKNTPDILHIPEYVRRIFSVFFQNVTECYCGYDKSCKKNKVYIVKNFKYTTNTGNSRASCHLKDTFARKKYFWSIFSVVIFNKKELQIITNLQKDWKLIKIVKWNSSFKGLEFCVHFWLISETYKMNDLGLIFTSENEQEN